MSSKTNQDHQVLLDVAEVRKMASLAKLKFGDDEWAAMAQSMSTILQLMRVLDEVDTTGVEPLFSPIDQTQCLRADVVDEAPHRDSLQAIAPDADDDYYRVPRVIDQR